MSGGQNSAEKELFSVVRRTGSGPRIGILHRFRRISGAEFIREALSSKLGQGFRTTLREKCPPLPGTLGMTRNHSLNILLEMDKLLIKFFNEGKAGDLVSSFKRNQPILELFRILEMVQMSGQFLQRLRHGPNSTGPHILPPMIDGLPIQLQRLKSLTKILDMVKDP